MSQALAWCPATSLSFQVSLIPNLYGQGRGNRTLASTLQRWDDTISLYPVIFPIPDIVKDLLFYQTFIPTMPVSVMSRAQRY